MEAELPMSGGDTGGRLEADWLISSLSTTLSGSNPLKSQIQPDDPVIWQEINTVEEI
jgi:hypothetical protein